VKAPRKLRRAVRKEPDVALQSTGIGGDSTWLIALLLLCPIVLATMLFTSPTEQTQMTEDVPRPAVQDNQPPAPKVDPEREDVPIVPSEKLLRQRIRNLAARGQSPLQIPQNLYKHGKTAAAKRTLWMCLEDYPGRRTLWIMKAGSQLRQLYDRRNDKNGIERLLVQQTELAKEGLPRLAHAIYSLPDFSSLQPVSPGLSPGLSDAPFR
jgi:hypothetical protein